MLNSVNYGSIDSKTVYCGPTAIAAVTGACIEDIYRQVVRYRMMRRGQFSHLDPVTWMENSEILYILRRFQKKTQFKVVERQMSLRKFFEGNTKTAIVFTHDHAIAVDNKTLLCSENGPNPIDYRQANNLEEKIIAIVTF